MPNTGCYLFNPINGKTEIVDNGAGKYSGMLATLGIETRGLENKAREMCMDRFLKKLIRD